MRIQLFGLSFALAVAGCGGDGDGGKVMVMPDAKVFMDAPPVVVPPCLTPATIPMGSIGNMTTPADGKFIVKSPQTGAIFFGLGFYMDQQMKTAMTIIVPRPMTTAGWMLNTPYNNDPDPNAAMPAALAFIEDGLDAAGNSAHFLYASNGATTFQAIGQTDNASIRGSMNATNFREIDGMSGADIAGGCTSMAAGISFNLTQDGAVMAPAPGVFPVPAWKIDALIERVNLK